MNAGMFLRRKARCVAIVGLILAWTNLTLLSVAQNSLSAAQQAQVDAIAQLVLAKTGVPSASVGIVTNGKIAYLKAYGKAQLNPPVEATPQMRYSVGSISKQFTATAILMLRQQGKLKLDDPISTWLPQLTRANEVTLREVLSHTSGYQDYYAEDYSMLRMKNPTTADAILDNWGKKPLDFDPGTQWQYSNTNFVLAGKIVEIVSGMPVMKFLQQNIFTPLQMTDVMNSDMQHLEQTDAHGYIRYALGPLRPAPQDGPGWMFAAGELAMPVRDLLLWDIAMMNESLLQPASYREMFTGVKLKDGQDTHYGLGVETSTRDGHLVISHSGEVSGFTSENMVLPQDKVAIAVFTNQEAVGAAGVIAGKIAAVLVGLPPNESKQSEEQARQIFIGLQQGKIDRSLFTENCNAYFDSQALGDFESSLKPLGAPIEFRQTAKESRGGMTFRVYDVVFPTTHLALTTYQMPDGKIEQFIVTPAE
ncbi:MAG: serine hydrolase domain-containing protein [Acidobacteriaceae bacterium]